MDALIFWILVYWRIIGQVSMRGIIFFIYVFIVILHLLPTTVLAARVFSVNDTQTHAVPDVVSVPIVFDTENKRLNVVSGTITVPDTLELVDIVSGESIVSFWIEAPYYNVPQRTIKFAGMVPGGFIATEAPLFTVRLRTLVAATSTLIFSDVIALAHDGQGTAVTLTAINPIIKSNANERADVVSIPSDDEPPELLDPLVLTDVNIEGGVPVVVWATTDKSGGSVTTYIREGRWNWYHIATSPYRLTKDPTRTTIYIKVVDESGNTRTFVIPAIETNREEFLWMWGLILIGLILVGWYYIKKYVR